RLRVALENLDRQPGPVGRARAVRAVLTMHTAPLRHIPGREGVEVVRDLTVRAGADVHVPPGTELVEAPLQGPARRLDGGVPEPGMVEGEVDLLPLERDSLVAGLGPCGPPVERHRSVLLSVVVEVVRNGVFVVVLRPRRVVVPCGLVRE